VSAQVPDDVRELLGPPGHAAYLAMLMASEDGHPIRDWPMEMLIVETILTGMWPALAERDEQLRQQGREQERAAGSRAAACNADHQGSALYRCDKDRDHGGLHRDRLGTWA